MMQMVGRSIVRVNCMQTRCRAMTVEKGCRQPVQDPEGVVVQSLEDVLEEVVLEPMMRMVGRAIVRMNCMQTRYRAMTVEKGCRQPVQDPEGVAVQSLEDVLEEVVLELQVAGEHVCGFLAITHRLEPGAEGQRHRLR